MVISGQLQVPGHLSLEKNPSTLLNKAGWAPKLSTILWKREKSLSLLGIETKCPSHLSCNIATMLTFVLNSERERERERDARTSTHAHTEMK
jgi:hypothetical protein